MDSRSEKKLKTRASLMQAALQLVEEGRHYSSVSIREVAKGGGVVPTAFYRHFTDMDDLGLNLVDELSLMLRQLLRKARQAVTEPGQLIDISLTLLFDYVRANRAFFVFMCQSLTGGSPVIRAAIRSELNFFANELSLDLRRLRLLEQMPEDRLDEVCQLTISAVAMVITELVDVPAHDDVQSAGLKRRLVNQLQVIFLGASQWQG